MKKVNLWSETDDSSIYKKIYLGQIFLKIAEWSDFLIADQYFQPRSRRFYTSTFGLEKPSISRTRETVTIIFIPKKVAFSRI